MEENIDYENTENEYEDNLETDELDNSEVSEDSGIRDDSDDYEDSQEPDSGSLRPKKIDIRERLNQVQRERYQAMQEAEILRHENESLRKTAEIASGQALQQYDENLKRRYENARIAKARAMEEGDIQSQIDADSDLAMISSELYQTNFIKAQNNYQSSQHQQSQYQAPQTPSHVNKWNQENPWMDASRPEYDSWLASEVKDFCGQFNYNLQTNGQGHLIESPEYLYHVDRRVSELMNQRNGQKRELNMKQSRTPVSPVRNGYSQNASRGQKVKPSQEEKDWARRLGIDEKTYLQHKLNDEKKNAHRRVS